MEVKIEVSNEMFAEVLDKELKALQQEELHSILVECIGEYFRQNNYNNIENLIVKKDRWGCYDGSSDFINSSIKSCDFSALQDVVDRCIYRMKNNYEYILRDIIANTFVTGLMQNCEFQHSLKTVIEDTIREIDIRKANPPQY